MFDEYEGYDTSFERNLGEYGIQRSKEIFPNGCIVVAGYNQLPEKEVVYKIVKKTIESRNDPTIIEWCQNPNFIAAKSGVIKGFILFSTMKISGSGNMGLGQLSESGVDRFRKICEEEDIPFKYYPDEDSVDEEELIEWIKREIFKPLFWIRLLYWIKKKSKTK